MSNPNNLFENVKPLQGDFIFGNHHNTKRFNFRSQISLIRGNPISEFLDKINSDESLIFRNEIKRQEEAYCCYFFSVERFYRQISLSIRFNRNLSSKRKKYSASEKALASEYNRNVRYTALDFFNCLIHARILMDRTIVLSRMFINEGNNPSFTSFSDHKKFFKKLETEYGKHQKYAQYIKSETDWFDFPLKAVRDKFIVHSSPKHMQYFGFPGGDYTDLCLVYTIPDNPEGNLGKVKMINVSIITLAQDIDKFLRWYCSYAVRAINDLKK